MDNLVTGPRSLAAINAVFTVVDAVGLDAVMGLNQAHNQLVKARVMAGSPPSDRWYRLLEQLEHDFTACNQLSTKSHDSKVPTVSEQVCKLLVCAAAFFASEASDLEDELALLSNDPKEQRLRAQLGKIANHAGCAADVLLKYAEDDAWEKLLELRDLRNITDAVLDARTPRSTNTASSNVVNLAIASPAHTQPQRKPDMQKHQILQCGDHNIHPRPEPRSAQPELKRRPIARLIISHTKARAAAAAAALVFALTVAGIALGHHETTEHIANRTPQVPSPTVNAEALQQKQAEQGTPQEIKQGGQTELPQNAQEGTAVTRNSGVGGGDVLPLITNVPPHPANVPPHPANVPPHQAEVNHTQSTNPANQFHAGTPSAHTCQAKQPKPQVQEQDQAQASGSETQSSPPTSLCPTTPKLYQPTEQVAKNPPTKSRQPGRTPSQPTRTP